MMKLKNNKKIKSLVMSGAVCLFLVFAIGVFTSGLSYAKGPKHKEFSSPEDAVKTLIEALRANDSGRLTGIFGEAGKQLFSSGDVDYDKEVREKFLHAYDEKNRIEKAKADKAVLHVGKKDWPWPVPIVKKGKGWVFDAKEGVKEIVARRIGKDEIAAVQVCLAYVDAQEEYARQHEKSGIVEYASKFTGDDGKDNGLCREGAKGTEKSPLGPMVAAACKADQAKNKSEPQPYHGYYYKMLYKQGKSAKGGEYYYIVDGKMIGGFALVAYPAVYATTGVMTFIVNQDGEVYEKNLGKKTEELAEAMMSYNPDNTWKKVE